MARIQTFADGSQLDLDTMKVVRQATPTAPKPQSIAPAPKTVSTSPTSDGYRSTDPNIQARIAEMQRQVSGQSSLSQPRPAPAPAPAAPPQPSSGYTSTDPNIQARIAEMQRQTMAMSNRAQPTPPPSYTPPQRDPYQAQLQRQQEEIERAKSYAGSGYATIDPARAGFGFLQEGPSKGEIASNPAALKRLEQDYEDIQFIGNSIYAKKIPRATVLNQQGDRRVVRLDRQEDIDRYFSQGYRLEKAPGVPSSPYNEQATPPKAVQTAPTPQAPTGTTIPFRPGLSDQQKQGITMMVAAKPAATWSQTDRANWSYATNNAPLPRSQSISTPVKPVSAPPQAQVPPARPGSVTDSQTYSKLYGEQPVGDVATFEGNQWNWKPGMSEDQKKSIMNLVSLRPTEQWSETDKRNWNYATNNAPLPVKGAAPGSLARGVAAPAPSQDFTAAAPETSGTDLGMSDITTPRAADGDFGFKEASAGDDQYAAILKALQASIEAKPGESAYAKQLAGFQAKSQEEIALEQKLAALEAQGANLNVSEEMGINEVLNQPIAQTFLSGQSAAIQRQAATKMKALEAQTVPLRAQLAQLQAQRQSALEAAKLGYGMEQDALQSSRQQQAAQLQMAQFLAERGDKARELKAGQKPIEIGGSLVMLNPKTGKYEAVYQGASETKYAPGSIGEYQFYSEQEKASGRKPMSFSEYQNADANRKALASQVAGASGMTPQQTSNFMTITNKYQGDSIIKSGSDAFATSQIADQVIANPGSSTNQMKALYSFISALDPGTAVKEGEQQLALGTQSFLSRFGSYFTKINQNQTLPPEVAKEFAQATKDLAGVWQQAAQRQQNKYQAQAQVVGLGPQWQQYVSAWNTLGTGTAPTPVGYIGGGGYAPLPTASEPRQTFEQFIAQYEAKKGMSLSPTQREALRAQYNASSGGSGNNPMNLSNFNQPLSMGQKGSVGHIVKVTVGGKDFDVSSDISEQLVKADADFFRATGRHIKMNEAFRSNKRQKELYERYQRGEGGRAAPPGKGFHEKGKAVDIANWEEAGPYLRKYGFRNDLKDDRNHFSIGEFG